jgi:hypothetical protein
MSRVHDCSFRAVATGEEAERLIEARRRLEAAASNLSYAAIGEVDPAEVLPDAIRLIDTARRLVERS